MDQELIQSYRELFQEPVTDKEYKQILESLIETLHADRGCLWLERENSFLYSGDEKLRKKFPFSRQAVDAVLRKKGRSFLSFAPDKDPRISERSSLSLNVRGCLAASCVDQNENFLVVAYFDRDASSGQFNHKDLKTLKMVLSMVPGAVPIG